MQLFYLPVLDPGAAELILGPEESHHATGVLRLRAGEQVEVTDGRGILCRCEIVAASARECRLRVQETLEHYGRMPYTLWLAVAPTKNNERYEWLLEKATEIGVTRITPVLCDRSERRVLKTERLHKLLLSAMKQSGRAYLPELDEPTPLRDFLKGSPALSANSPSPGENPGACTAETDGGSPAGHSGKRSGTIPDNGFGKAQKFIGHCTDSPLATRVSLASALRPGGNYVMLVGPEGDFSPAEVEAALAAGFTPVTLGDVRLRTETAGLMVAATTAVVNELGK